VFASPSADSRTVLGALRQAMRQRTRRRPLLQLRALNIRQREFKEARQAERHTGAREKLSPKFPQD